MIRLLLAPLLIGCWLCPCGAQAPRTSNHAKLFPSSSIAYLELSDPSQLVTTIFDHPLRERIEELDAFKVATQSKGYKQFMLGVLVVEGQLSMTWREAVAAFSANGACIAFDPKRQDGALVLHGKDSEAIELLREKALGIAALSSVELEESSYRGAKLVSLENGHFAFHEDKLVLSGKPELRKAILDRMIDGGESLADNPRFQQALAKRVKSTDAWAFVDVDAIRNANFAKNVFEDQINNPIGELLIGGIQSCLKETPFVTASLSASTNEAKLTTNMPFAAEWIPEPREYFFGPEADGRAPNVIPTEETLFTLNTYRNFSQMWLWAGDLYNAEINDGFAQADAQLTTFFSGKDFGEDILGSLEPEVTFVATRQDFSGRLPSPTIKLPSFAIVMNLREPEKMTRDFRRIFQSMIGFINVVGAMEGNPQLEMDMEKLDNGAQFVTSSYIPEEDEEDSKEAHIVHNFSPTVGFCGKRFVIASTTSLAKQLAVPEMPAPMLLPDNTRMQLQGDTLQSVLSDNREQLIAQNMLEDGNSREEAESIIDLVLQFVGYYKDATLRLETEDDQLSAEFSLRLEP